MDRPKHHWIVFVGLALVSCGVVLLALQWLYPAADVDKPTPVTPLPLNYRSSDRAEPAAPVTPAAEASAAVLRGRVIDAVTRSPIEKFEVQLQPFRHDSEVEPPPLTRSFHSESGRFAWQDAPIGTWKVSVAAPDHQRFEIEALSITAGQQTSDLLVPLLRGYKVTGRVFDARSSAGIADASISYAESGELGFSGGNARSKKDGAFVLEGVPRGRVKLTVYSQAHAHRELDIDVSEQTPPVEIGLSRGGTISGFLVTASGAPVAGPVALVNDQNASFMKRTDEAGAFSFDRLSAGRYRLGAGAAWQEIVLGPDELREGIVLTAAVFPGRTVRGTVRGLRPEEMKRAFVVLRSETRRATAMRPLDEQGAFVLREVPPGRAEIKVDADSVNRTVVRTIEVPANRDLVVDIEIPAGVRVSGRVTQGGKPVAAGRAVRIAPAGGSQGSFHRAMTADGGTYRIDGVPAGEYDITAQDGAGRRIAISGDSVIDLEVPAVQLSGLVLEEHGTVPIVGALVYIAVLEGGAPSARRFDTSDHFGRFELLGLEPGDVVVSAYKPGYELFRERITYVSPVANKSIRLRPGTGVEIGAHVASSGAAVRDLQVIEALRDGGGLGIVLQVRLDENGVGSIPSGLAGSTLTIEGAGRSIVVREWDGQPLDLQLR